MMGPGMPGMMPQGIPPGLPPQTPPGMGMMGPQEAPPIPGQPGMPGAPTPPENEQSKSTEAEYRIGTPINLDRQMNDGQTLRDKLSGDVARWLDQEIRNQEKLIANLGRWQNLYSGIKDEKNWPYPGASNTAIPITRAYTDAVLVRVMDAIWGQQKCFIVKGKKQPFIDLAPDLEDGLEWWQKSMANLKKKCFSPLMQAMKTGTGIIKVGYVRKKRTITRYATPEETQNPEIQTYMTPEQTPVVKQVITDYDGPDVFPVAREDWVMSSDATSIKDAFLCGFKRDYRIPAVENRVRQGFWDAAAVSDCRKTVEIDETKRKRSEVSGKTLSVDTIDKIRVWELWLRYDVDEDGEEDDIVINFNLESKKILRAIHNPLFGGFRPFILFVANPVEYSAEGEGICQILEKIAVLIDTIHNQRIDRMNQINGPMYLVQSGMGVDDFKIAPGLVRVVEGDPNLVIKELRFSDVAPSSFNEESLINNYAQQAVGVSPNVLGQSTSERPVAKETLSLIEEANKKFKFMIDNFRENLSEVGMMALELFAQHQPQYSYTTSQGQQQVDRVLNFPLEYLRDGLVIDLTASSEMMNQEARRQIGLTIYELVKDYMTGIVGTINMVLNPMAPPPLKMILMESIKVAVSILRQIVRDFGIRNEEEFILDPQKYISPQMIMAPPMPPPPPPGQEGGNGEGPGGPPQQGPPGPPQGPPQ